ncbi:MAG: pyridoxal phosphate-dependent aminotransferase family protein [Planctomycetes bacterium]|nr:pyridoxal phosphate-dependent aminotransferase family protein [Planctomycetota bacterium]
MSLFDKCKNYTRVTETKEAGYYPYFKPIQSGANTTVKIYGREMIMVGSNNYLGLTQHPKVKEASIKAVEKYGSGCTGSRFLNGTLDIHEELESKLAHFMKKESCLVVSTGFQTNQAVISTVVGKDDVIIIDRSNHASIIDGCRLSFGRTLKYKHNDMADLERILSRLDNPSKALIIVDGVFSMEGNLANLPEIVKLKKKFGARLMVDDAHGIGVMGHNGRGTAEHFGVENETDIIMGTFSKSFASLGGFVVATESVINYIKHNARALMFSASPPPAAVATVLAALEIMGQEPERRDRLRAITKKMLTAFKAMGFDTGETQTPIIPIVTGELPTTFEFWKRLFSNGVFTNPVVAPAVPPNRSMIRTSYMATHQDKELNKVLELFRKVGKEMGLIN